MKSPSTSAAAALLIFFCSLPLGGCGSSGSGYSAPAMPGTPSMIALPNGFQPEGIAASGNTLYVGSIPSGAIFRADASSGAGSLLVAAQAGRAAIGLKVDGRGRLWVAGGGTGRAFVYDAANGQELATYTLTTSTPTFVNDLALTSDAAWFTDSAAAVLYRLALPADGTLGGPEAVSTLPLTGDFQLTAGATNLNGIVAAGSFLIAVQTNAGLLFRIDPATGVTQQINLGSESVPNGDGLLLEGQTLYVVQNRANLIAVIDLAAGFGSGTLRTRLADPAFDVPTTIARSSSGLYVVNARFGVTVTPDTPYNVVRVAAAAAPAAGPLLPMAPLGMGLG